MDKEENRSEDPSFFSKVFAVVAAIPCGKVVSYGQIACRIGHPRAARMVGWAMRRCPQGLPWHRVIRTDGTLAIDEDAGFHRAMLEGEGISFLPDGRVDMALCRWDIPLDHERKG